MQLSLRKKCTFYIVGVIVEEISDFFSDIVDWFVAIPVIPWILFPEETATNYFSHYPWHALVFILISIDIILAVVEYIGIWLLWRKSDQIAQIQTPRWLRKIAQGQEISYPDLYIFGLTPHCHKFGVIGLFARRKKLGIRGFVALELGSFCRLIVYPIMGKYLFLIVVVFLLVRFWEWQKRKGYLERACKRFWW